MPKIIGSSLADHREQTRARLLTAFSELVAERGLDNVAISDVAERSGIGRTALYNHFSGKEELLLGHIMAQTERYLGVIRTSIAAAGESPVDQLRAYVHDMLLLDHPYQMAPDVRSLLSPDLAQRVREHVRSVEVVLRSIITSGIERGDFPEQDVDVVVTLINACLTGRRAPADQEGRSRMIDQTQEFVLRAVGATPHA